MLCIGLVWVDGHMANEVTLANIHAVVAQDGIGCRGVKEKVGQGKLQKVVFAACPHGFCKGQGDLAGCRIFEIFRGEAVEVFYGFIQALSKLVVGLLGVFECRRLFARKARGGKLCRIGDRLDLANKVKHIRRESRVEQVNVVFCLVGFGLVEDVFKCADGVRELLQCAKEHGGPWVARSLIGCGQYGHCWCDGNSVLLRQVKQGLDECC